jgi:hypothetical protein
MHEKWSLVGGQYFGMNFGIPGVVFAEILAADFKKLKYNLGSTNSIAVGATLGPGFIGKTSWNNGDNLIGIPKEYPDHLYHIRWNIKPSKDMRVYEWFETTQTGNLDNESRDKTSDFGFLTGEDIDDHPEYAERIIPFMSKLQYSFYNMRDGASVPEMNFEIYEYIVRYVNPKIQTVLAEDLVFGNIPRKIFPMGDVTGGLPGYSSASEIKQKIGVLPVTVPEYSKSEV